MKLDTQVINTTLIRIAEALELHSKQNEKIIEHLSHLEYLGDIFRK